MLPSERSKARPMSGQAAIAPKPVLLEAEQKLMQLYGASARNFLEENEKLHRRKLEKIEARFERGKAAVCEAENQIMVEMHRLKKELGQLQGMRAELERAKEEAQKEALSIREESAKEYLRRQDAQVKQHIDSHLKPH